MKCLLDDSRAGKQRATMREEDAQKAVSEVQSRTKNDGEILHVHLVVLLLHTNGFD